MDFKSQHDELNETLRELISDHGYAAILQSIRVTARADRDVAQGLVEDGETDAEESVTAYRKLVTLLSLALQHAATSF